MALSKIFVAPKNGQGGVKKSKKNFSQKKYSKDGKNKFWDLWDHNFIFGKSSDRFRTLTLPPLPAPDRPTVTSLSYMRDIDPNYSPMQATFF